MPRNGWVVCAAAFVMTAVTLLRTERLTPDHPEFHFAYQDHHKYLWMSENGPLSLRIAPFGWRVLVPTLGGALPFDVELNYAVVSFVCVWLTAVFVFLLLRKFEFSVTCGWLGMLTYFSMAWPTKYLLYNFWNPDAAAYLCITLAVFFIASRRPVSFAIALAIGATVKESTLFVAPLFYTFTAIRVFDRRAALRTLAVTLPAVVVLVALRVGMPQRNGDPAYLETLPEILRAGTALAHYDYRDLAVGTGGARFQALTARDLEYYTLAPFGVMALLSLFALRRNWIWFFRFLPFLMLVYAQLGFAADKERLVALGFLPIVILAVNGMDGLAGRLGSDVGRLTLLPVLLWTAELVAPARIGAPIEIQLILLVVCLAVLTQLEPSKDAEASVR